MHTNIEYLANEPSAFGKAVVIAEGVYWVRMPLPFQLDHINLWLIEEEGGWALVDTGINNVETKKLWLNLLSSLAHRGHLTRLICTHAHPDHMGLAGWFCREFELELWTTQNEWHRGIQLSRNRNQEEKEFTNHFIRAGCSGDQVKTLSKQLLLSDRFYEKVPNQHETIKDNDQLNIGERRWKVIVGQGHSIEHACLYCEEIDVLIGGDQILPKITPTITLPTYDPSADPLRAFLATNQKFCSLATETKVLPSHNLPFRGLHTRLAQYQAHHDERLKQTLAACACGSTAVEVAETLFGVKSDPYHLFFSVGETLSHLRYLETSGSIVVDQDCDGVAVYQHTS